MNNDTKSNTRKNTLLLLAGAIAGAAGTYYLQTPQGKKLTKRAIDKSKQVGSDVSTKAQQIAEDTKVKANTAIHQASEAISTAKTVIADKTVNLLDRAETKVGGFQEGINKAKESMKNGVHVS